MLLEFVILTLFAGTNLREDIAGDVLEDIEELHHLGLSVTDLQEIRELRQTVSAHELETLEEVLASLSEDQLGQLAEKSPQELDLIFYLQWNKSEARRRTKRSASPFGLSLTADIRTQHVTSQGWPGGSHTFPPPLPLRYGVPVPTVFQHQQTTTGYYGGGLGAQFYHGGRYRRSADMEDQGY